MALVASVLLLAGLMLADAQTRVAHLASDKAGSHLAAGSRDRTSGEVARDSAAVFVYDEFDHSGLELDARDVPERPEQVFPGGRIERGCAACGYDDPTNLARASARPAELRPALNTTLNTSGIRFSPASVNNVDEIATSMRASGWVGDSIDVVRMPGGGLTTLDNSRVLAAHQAGINVQARVHSFDDLLPSGSVGRFTTAKGGAPTSLRTRHSTASVRRTHRSETGGLRARPSADGTDSDG